MSRPYEWDSPGGTYRVPDAFRTRFLTDFPDYRIRWSLTSRCWLVEQRCGSNVLPPVSIDEAADDLIRAVDGYWLVMSFQPGDRMACPGIIQKLPRRTCGYTLMVPHRAGREVVCPICRAKGRDGRTIAAYWPFDECLLDALRRTNPLTWGITKVGSKTMTRAAATADAANRRLLADAEARRRDAGTIDAVDYRWISGIGASTGLRRQIDSKTFL